MPKPISDEELQLKVRARRRILGAIALVVLLVLFLPMVLDSKPKREAQGVSLNIPPQDAAPSFNPSLNSVVPSAEKPEGAEKIAPAGEVAEVESQALVPNAKLPDKSIEKQKVMETNKLGESKKAPQIAKIANAKPGKFAVQLGVFSNPENARQVEDRLQESKIRHYREMLQSPPGAIRVRAGPYPTRSEAEVALTRLKLAGISGGVVVSE